MCIGKDVKSEIKVTEIEKGYKVEITGDKVKNLMDSDTLKKCIQTCCSQKKDSCCH